MTTWWFRRQRGVPTGTLDERFTNLADRVSETAGRWQVSGFCFLLFFVWLGSGPALQWSDTWQLIANTPTTWAELWLGLFTLAAANRVEKRNYTLHQEVAALVRHIGETTDMEQQEIQHEGVELDGLVETMNLILQRQQFIIDKLGLDESA